MASGSGFVKLPNAIFYVEGLKPIDIAVFSAILLRNPSYPSMKRIGQDIGATSRTTVWNAIKRLEKRNMIEVKRDFGKTSTYKAKNHLNWNFEEKSDSEPVQNMNNPTASKKGDVFKKWTGGVQNMNTGCSKYEQGGVQNMNTNKTKIITPSNKTKIIRGKNSKKQGVKKTQHVKDFLFKIDD